MRRRHGGERPIADLETRGRLELGPGRAVLEVGRSPAPRRAVHVPELGTRERHRPVGVPAAAAEHARRKSALAQPRALAQDARARVAVRRPRMRRAREVRVVTEWPPRRRLPRALEPALLVRLARGRVRRSHERGDREAAGPPQLQRAERRPHRVVERSFDVARDHCVPFRSRGRHRATDTTRRRPPGGGSVRRAPPSRPRDRARPDPRGVRREERHLRADARRERHLRVPPRCPVGLHPAPVRVVPRRALLAARPLVGRRRRRSDPCRRGDRAARAGDRDPPRLGAHRGSRRPRGHPAPVPRVARHPRQPRDPRRPARRRNRAPGARRL